MSRFRPHPKDAKLYGTIYLVHFDEPYKHARHYLGFAPGDVDERMVKHMLGTGSNLMRVVSAVGISWRLARLWKGTRADERRLKNGKQAPRYCPICSEKPRPIRFIEPLPLDGAVAFAEAAS